MFPKIAFRFILHNLSGSAGSILGVVLLVFLVGVELAIFGGVIDNITNIMTHSGTDFWVVSKNTDNFEFSSLIPMSYVDRISGLPQVQSVTPLINGGGLLKHADGKFQYIYLKGIKIPEMVAGPWNFSKGSTKALLDPFGMTLDSSLIHKYHVLQTDHLVQIDRKKMHLDAITQNIRVLRGDLGFMSLQNARRIGKFDSDKAHSFLIKIKDGVALDEIQAKLNKLLPNATTLKTKDLTYKTAAYVLINTGIGISLLSCAALAAGIGIVIIALTIYNNTLHFSSEIAILRIMGARKIDITKILIYDVLILCAIGLLIGFFLLALFFNFTLGTQLPLALPIWFWPLHIAVTILCSLGASLFAMRHALLIDPTTVFR